MAQVSLFETHPDELNTAAAQGARDPCRYSIGGRALRASLATAHARKSAWLHLVAQAVTVLAWLRLHILTGDFALAEPKALRFRLLSAPAHSVRRARARMVACTWSIHGGGWTGVRGSVPLG